MPNYIRPKVTGATVFFTVNLADRSSGLLVERIEELREAVARTRSERPFGIDACVVLPDHMHCVWTLPAGDRDFSTRWKDIAGSPKQLVWKDGGAPAKLQKARKAFGNGDFGTITSGINRISSGTSGIVGSIR